MASLDMTNLKIMVIDDESFMRQLIIRILREFGIADVISAEHGYDGLEKVDVHGSGIDLIICDLEMPKLDGFAFIMKLRELPNPSKASIPVVILTGNSEVENIRMAVRLGINGFLVKPLSKQKLEEAITQAFRGPMIDKASMED